MIRALLWDADGVLQHSPFGWQEALDAAGGDGFAQALFDAELPALRGEEPLRTALERAVREWPHPIDVDAERLLELWERAVVDEQAMALVAELRAGGMLGVLATNQQDHRRAWMRDTLGYDALFDRVFYSCELGVMKPDPAFFTAILDDLGIEPNEAAFVDDNLDNVEAAAALGIRSVRHDPATGSAQLRRVVVELVSGEQVVEGVDRHPGSGSR